MPLSPRDVAERYVGCLRDGDFPTLVTLHHEQLVCSLLGTTLVSGRYRGRDGFFAHTFEHVLGALAPGSESYLKDYRIGAADDRYAALLLHGGLPTSAGGRYDQNYLQIFKVTDGRIVEIHELLDTAMLETQVLGKTQRIERQWPDERLQPALRSKAARDARLGDTRSIESGTRARAVAEKFTAALAAADWPRLLAMLDPDVVAQIAGSTPVSGTLRGRTALESGIKAHLSRHFLSASLHLDASPPRLVCSDAGGFCVMLTVTGRLHRDGEYHQTAGVIGTMQGEAIVELQIYFDTAAEEAQTFGNPLSGGSTASGPEPFSFEPDAGAP